MNSKTLTEARALAAHEGAAEQEHLWAAILAVHEALEAGGLPGLASIHVERAKAALLRSGGKSAGDYTDAELRAIAVTDGVRVWSQITGTIYKNETVVTDDGNFYICLQQHIKEARLVPGTLEGRTLFRPIREEPKDGGVLDFMWGELVPFGAKRRDPIDGKVYTPIHPEGVTLYEPHYPHLVPSEYKLVEDDDGGGGDGGDDGSPKRWADLPDQHLFNVGDRFTDYGKTYEVLRQFYKQDSYRPPALIDDYYKLVQ